MKKLTLYTTCMLLISGCTNRAYIEPTEPHAATLEFVNRIDNPDLFYSAFTYKDIKQCTNRQNVAFMSKEKNKTVKIKPSEPIVITSIIPQSTGVETILLVGGFGAIGAIGALASGTKYGECKPTLEFTPKENHHYKLMMSTNAKGCEFSFTEIDPSNNANPAFEFVAHKWKPAFTEDGAWCD
ncbi:hypothetical protein [Pseudomonas sp. PS02288]|uniref:hypothetical protein n=1 Tax=Pseudomonas sp. PS02288 TaxID=2991443 RepID=UPI00249AB08D|nr:hypothetical protein [Pseudomonas sp. PS02288]